MPDPSDAAPAAPKPAAAQAAPAVQVDVAAAPAAPPSIEDKVRGWVNDCLSNSPVARSTDAWNHVQAQVPELVKRLGAS